MDTQYISLLQCNFIVLFQVSKKRYSQVIASFIKRGGQKTSVLQFSTLWQSNYYTIGIFW